jgi:surface antigen
MPVTPIVGLAFALAAIGGPVPGADAGAAAMGAKVSGGGRTAVVGYLDTAGTTITLYRTKAALKARDRDMCMDATMFPLSKVGMAVAHRGRKVTAYGYVVTNDYYLEQQGDDIAQGLSPIQNLCRNPNVMTIIELAD